MKSIIIYIVLLVALFPQAAFSEKLIHLKSMRQMQSEKINKQTFDYSCGAASLAILFRYYFNDDIDEKTILADIVYRLDKNAIEDRARNGFSMLDLKLSAERLGYVADGVKLSLDSVKRLKGPIIILLKTDKENHFVVLKGVTNNRAFISDPIRGNLRLSLSKLAEIWHGEALILGLDDFGIPQKHELKIPDRSYMLPEEATARVFKSIPLS